MRIGLVISDSEGPNQSEFRFVASHDVATGQFIEARTPEGLYLALVSNVKMSNPDYEGLGTVHHALTMKSETSFDMKGLEVFGTSIRLGTAQVLGIYDAETGAIDFTGTVAPPGTEIHSADPERLARVLSEDPEGLDIGSVYGNHQVRVAIPTTALYHHVAVVGSTGSGKSYAGAVLCEELARRGSAVVVIDPHGEYASLGMAKSATKTDPGEARPRFEVQEYTPARAYIEGTREISLRLSQLSADDLLHTMDVPGERQRILLLSSFEEFTNRVRRGEVEDSIGGLVSVVRTIGERGFGTTTDSTIIRLSKLNELGILGKGFDATELVKEGSVTVLNISGLDQLSEVLIVGALLRVLFRERRHERVPPFILFLEEIHRYAPSTDTPTKEALSTLVKEGRKFQVGVVALSQRPSDIDAVILTQCNTILILRLFDRADIERIRSRLGSLAALESSLPNFPAGRAILSGLATRFPVVLQVRHRFTGNGSTHSRRVLIRAQTKENLFQHVSLDSRDSRSEG